jgi:hypothetical protein
MTRWHIIALLATGLLFAAVPGGGKAAPPDRIWVAPHALPNGGVVPGYWRTAAAPGYVWIEGHADAEGQWVPGYWRPQGDPARSKVWVAGYWMDGAWHAGRWMTPKAGRTWISGHYNPRGSFVPGHWR